MRLSIKIYPRIFFTLNISKYFGKKSNKLLRGRHMCYCPEWKGGKYHSLKTSNKILGSVEKSKYLVNT